MINLELRKIVAIIALAIGCGSGCTLKSDKTIALIGIYPARACAGQEAIDIRFKASAPFRYYSKQLTTYPCGFEPLSNGLGNLDLIDQSRIVAPSSDDVQDAGPTTYDGIVLVRRDRLVPGIPMSAYDLHDFTKDICVRVYDNRGAYGFSSNEITVPIAHLKSAIAADDEIAADRLNISERSSTLVQARHCGQPPNAQGTTD